MLCMMHGTRGLDANWMIKVTGHQLPAKEIGSEVAPFKWICCEDLFYQVLPILTEASFHDPTASMQKLCSFEDLGLTGEETPCWCPALQISVKCVVNQLLVNFIHDIDRHCEEAKHLVFCFVAQTSKVW